MLVEESWLKPYYAIPYRAEAIAVNAISADIWTEEDGEGTMSVGFSPGHHPRRTRRGTPAVVADGGGSSLPA